MGLPTIAIPTNLVDQLPDILRAEGLNVTIRELNQAERERGFVILMTCQSAEGGQARLYAQTTPIAPPGTVIGILEPTSPTFRSLFKDDHLIDKVEDILVAHGAIGRPKKKTSGEDP